jgi:hypothetical protein
MTRTSKAEVPPLTQREATLRLLGLLVLLDHGQPVTKDEVEEAIWQLERANLRAKVSRHRSREDE